MEIPVPVKEPGYWAEYKLTVHKERSPIIQTVLSGDTLLAVTCSRLCFISDKSHHVPATNNDFSSAAYRQDGKLLVVGDSGGNISALDATRPRSAIKTYSEHSASVSWLQFTENKFVSGSDDYKVKLFDVSGGLITTFSGHTDHVRCGDVWNGLILTGSYDHTVKLWDPRTGNCVQTISHGAPVEDVLMFPQGSSFVSCGGSFFKVSSLGSNSNLLTSNHQKTITCLAFADNNSKLVTGSLDKMLKVFDLSNYSVVHSTKYPSPILSCALTNNVVAVGMLDGSISIRKKTQKQESQQIIRLGTYKYWSRGKNSNISPNLVVNSSDKAKPLPFNYHLRRFQFKSALDSAVGFPPEIFVVLLRDLLARGVMERALANRSVESILPILKYMQRKISDPQYSRTIIDAVHIFVDLYENSISQSPQILKLIRKMMDSIKMQIEKAPKVSFVLGAMDCIFSQSNK